MMERFSENVDKFVKSKIDGKVYVVASWDGKFYTLMGAEIIIVESLKDFDDYKPED